MLSSPAVASSADRAARRPSAAPASAAPARTPRPAQRGCRIEDVRAAAPPSRSATWAISGLNDGRPLAAIQPRHRIGVRRVGAEPVDGLGRERDQPAAPQAAARPPLSAASPGRQGRWCVAIQRSSIESISAIRACLRRRKVDAISRPLVGVWLSPVEHRVRDAGVAGSNPATPTSLFNSLCFASAAVRCDAQQAGSVSCPDAVLFRRNLRLRPEDREGPFWSEPAGRLLRC